MSGAGRQLGPLLATVLVAGNMIGSGVYLLPAGLAAYGSIGLVGWIGGLAAALVFAALFARLASIGAGGFVETATAALGPRIGFTCGALYWAQALLGNVAIALAATGYLGALLPGLHGQSAATLVTILLIWAMVAAALLGPRFVARLEGWTLLIGLAPVLLVGIAGWAWFDPARFAGSWNVSGQPAAAIVPQLVVLVLWAFLGLESASIGAELVRDPRRTVPIATIGGVLLAGLVYIAACTAISGILPARTIAASNAPFAAVAATIVGGPIAGLVAACAALKALGTLGGWVLLTGESAHLSWTVARGAPGGRGPAPLTLILSGALMSAVALATTSPSLAAQFTVIVNMVVGIMLLLYAAAGLALLRLDHRWPARAAGGGAILVAAAIVASQGWAMIAGTALLTVLAVLAWPLVRLIATGRHAIVAG